MVACLHGGHGWFDVHLILGGDQRRLPQLPLSGQRFPAFKTVGIINVMFIGKAPAPDRIGFSDGDKAHVIGVVESV
jgi:hypothetical protein